MDHRAFEEGGHIYWSLHKHKSTPLSPKEWYRDSDADIEQSVLCMFQDWLWNCKEENEEESSSERAESYTGLNEPVADDARQALAGFLNIRDSTGRQKLHWGSPLLPGQKYSGSSLYDRERRVWKREIVPIEPNETESADNMDDNNSEVDQKKTDNGDDTDTTLHQEASPPSLEDLITSGS